MADINSALRTWSATASNNQPTGATPIGTNLDDNLRQIQATVRQFLASPGSTIASGSTVDLSAADGRTIPVSGSATVTGLGTEVAGMEYLLAIGGTQTWKNSSAMPLGADQVFTLGDIVWAKSEGAGNWTFPGITRKNSLSDSVFKILGSDSLGKSLSFDAHTFLGTAQGVTLFSPNVSGIVSTTTDPSGRYVIPDHISGFALSNNGSAGMDIAAGVSSDSTNTYHIKGSASNKSQSSWSAGTSAGGKLSAASMANDTWYYWFNLRKDTDGTVDYGFDVATSPTLPSGYSFYRYLGARKTQSASTNWDSFTQHGDQVTWNTPRGLDNTSVVGTASRTLITVQTPAVKTEWIGVVTASAGSGTNSSFILTDPAATDVAPNGAGAANLPDMMISNTTGTSLIISGQARCWTNTSSQIGVRAQNATNGVPLQTRGWIDPRGKPV